MTGVQLIGTKAVVSKYEKLNCDSWAIYQSKQFIVGGVGSEGLQEWVQDFETAGSTATYTLRVYDSGEAPTSATANSDYVACINFKVVDQYEGYGIAGHSNKLMQRIEGLEKKLKDQDSDEDDEGPDLNEVIMGWLTEPQKLGMVIGAVRQLFGGEMPVMPAVASPAPLQTVSGLEPVKINPMTEEGLTRISKALDILGVCDPDLVVHLEKLAKLAETDKLLFKAVISKLDAL